MVDKPQPVETKVDPEQPAAATPPVVPPRRAPGHRSTDARDTVAEMALRAQEISQEAGSKIAQAIKDVINAAAGLTGFAVESARDIVQYMVRRGQMTQEEADRIMREAEEASSKRKPAVKPAPAAAAPSMPAPPAPPKITPAVAKPPLAPAKAAPVPVKVAPAKPAPPEPKKAKAPAKKAAAKPAAKKKPASPPKSKPAKHGAAKKKR